MVRLPSARGRKAIQRPPMALSRPKPVVRKRCFVFRRRTSSYTTDIQVFQIKPVEYPVIDDIASST